RRRGSPTIRHDGDRGLRGTQSRPHDATARSATPRSARNQGGRAMTSCYTDDILGQLIADPGSVADHAAVEAHVETCPHCQQALGRVSGGNPQDSWLRCLRPEPLPYEENSSSSFLSRLKTNNPLVGNGSAADTEGKDE